MTFIYKLRNLFRRRRHKPLYKKFIGLKRNVQYRRKIFLFRFKNRKWKNFLSYYRKSIKNFRRRVAMFDHMKNVRMNFIKLSFKKRYSYNLITKKKINLFYGSIPKKKIKKYVYNALKPARIRADQSRCNLSLLKLLENRLDTVLYRSHFSTSMRGSMQMISHGYVCVNKQTVKSKSYQLTPGDIIQIKPKYRKIVSKNVRSNHLWPIPPKHLQINYNTLQIVLHDQIKFTNLSTHFPFKLDLNSFIKFYNFFNSSVGRADDC